MAVRSPKSSVNTGPTCIAKHWRSDPPIESVASKIEANSKYSIDAYLGGHVEGAKKNAKWSIATKEWYTSSRKHLRNNISAIAMVRYSTVDGNSMPSSDAVVHHPTNVGIESAVAPLRKYPDAHHHVAPVAWHVKGSTVNSLRSPVEHRVEKLSSGGKSCSVSRCHSIDKHTV